MKALKWFLATVLLALTGCATDQGGTTDDYTTTNSATGSSPAVPLKEPFRRDFPNTDPLTSVPER